MEHYRVVTFCRDLRHPRLLTMPQDTSVRRDIPTCSISWVSAFAPSLVQDSPCLVHTQMGKDSR